MNPEAYSEEEKKDIEDRVAKARMALEDLQLKPSASISASNIGDDVFALKVAPYLQDTKYSPKLSPKLSPIRDV